jgi:hypothetical protein
MRRLNLVTEGRRHAELLRAVLPEISQAHDDVAFEIWEGQGWSDADSLARSILAVRREPVVLIVDANSTDEQSIEERRLDLADLLRQYGPREMWAVVLMVPEIEAIFFEDVALLRSLLGVQPKGRVLEKAKYNPREALEELLKQVGMTYPAFLKTLQSADLSKLREAHQLRPIIDFLRLSDIDDRRSARRRRAAAG